MSLKGQRILITGAAVRVGKAMALSLADAGADLILHYNASTEQAEQTQAEVQAKGVAAHLLQANLNNSEEVAGCFEQARNEFGPIHALVNNASIFESIDLFETDLKSWQEHLNINLTAPFLLSQAFAKSLPPESKGRIVNILDWRATRPGADHFPYTISKAGLAALTQASALALAPNITVNGIAFGAILPPSDGGDSSAILKEVPAGRWAELDEVGETLRFLLEGPEYITGEIIHLDGGRHLV